MRLTRAGNGGSRRTGAMIGAVLLVLAVITWAWVDGGREPLHEIAQPIPVPASAR